MSLAVSALILWAFSGWSWWAAVALVGGLILVRLPLALVPAQWRQPVSNWLVVVLALFVNLWLVTLVTTLAVGVAAGAAGLVLVWQLRTIWPRWAWWTAAGTAAALMVGCGIAAWLVWLAESERRADIRERDREQRIAEMRPDTPREAVNRLVREIAYNDAKWACWLFTPAAAAQLADAVGTADCPSAIHTLHSQIHDGRTGVYGGAQVRAQDVQQPQARSVAYADACDLFVMDKFDYVPAPGPQLGQLTLELEPTYQLGYLITGYTPCGEPVPGRPPTTTTPPAALPSYPPAIASLLTAAIADSDTSACAYFTDHGRSRLAAIVGTDTCTRQSRSWPTRSPTRLSTPPPATPPQGPDRTRPPRSTPASSHGPSGATPPARHPGRNSVTSYSSTHDPGTPVT